MFRSAAIYGQPVAHSRSPLIHGAWLQDHQLSGAYLKKEVSPAQLPQLLKDFKQTGLAGANLTLPLKEVACAYVQLDEVAAKLQAVNVIWLDQGKLYGTNTDAFGFVAACNDQAPQWRKNLDHVLVLGAGGAAKAVIYGFLKEGCPRITLINRTRTRAESLGALFGSKIKSDGFEKLNEHLSSATMLVNTTSLGMKGQPELDFDLDGLKKDAIVADIVYAPLQTRLLKAAEERGHQTVDGLAMLLHQAAPAFERWFGIRPAVTKELRNLVAADLEQIR